MRNNPSAESFTVPELAEREHIGQSKLRAWIESGELLAVNLATRRGSRPRWHVSRESWDAFKLARSNAGLARARRRHRSQRFTPAHVTQYI
jgi:hypothetical protein